MNEKSTKVNYYGITEDFCRANTTCMINNSVHFYITSQYQFDSENGYNQDGYTHALYVRTISHASCSNTISFAWPVGRQRERAIPPFCRILFSRPSV